MWTFWKLKVHTNQLKTYHKKRFWAATLVVQILLFFVFSKLKFVIDLFEVFFEFQKKIHQKLFSWIPFSLGDIFYIFLGYVLLFLIIRSFKRKYRSQSLVQILLIGNIFYFTYQIFWGMLYFQTHILEKLRKTEVTLEKRKKLALKYLLKCGETRKLVHEDENGIFTITNLNHLQKEIIQQQTKLPQFISNKKNTGIIDLKSSLFKSVMNYSGILGYYNPFTAEAQYNEDLPSSYLAFTMAHESSHQLGFAREQEANFIGYLVGIRSENLELRYSTEYFTLKSLLNSIVYEDRNFVESVLAQYSLAMKRDRAFEKNFAEMHQGVLDDFFGFTNNLFLKSNQQDGSVTYSYFINLLVHYEQYMT